MGDMADYYRDNEDCDIYNDEVFNNEYYEHIWVNYQKGKLHWTTKDGKRLLISNMEDSHILNTINHLKSKTESNLAVDEWLDVFSAEIKNRNK
jgi:fatty acid-binding protein DegV